MKLISIYYNSLYNCRTVSDFVDLYEFIAEDDRISDDEFNRWEREYFRCYEEKIGEPITII